MIEGALTSIEDLKDWFLSHDTPFYTMYLGSKVDPTRRSLQNDSEGKTDPQAVWSDLEYHLKRMGSNGGTFHICVKNKESGKAPLAYATLQLAPFAQKYTIPGNAAAMPPTPIINGVPDQKAIDKAIQEAIKAAEEKWRQEKEIESLKQELEELRQKPKGGINGLLEEHSGTIGNILGQIAIMGAQKMFGVATPPPNPVIPPPTANANATNNVETPHAVSGHDEEEDELDEAIDNLSEAGFTPADLLKLSKAVKQNPDLYKSMLNNL